MPTPAFLKSVAIFCNAAFVVVFLSLKINQFLDTASIKANLVLWFASSRVFPFALVQSSLSVGSSFTSLSTDWGSTHVVTSWLEASSPEARPISSSGTSSHNCQLGSQHKDRNFSELLWQESFEDTYHMLLLCLRLNSTSPLMARIRWQSSKSDASMWSNSHVPSVNVSWYSKYWNLKYKIKFLVYLRKISWCKQEKWPLHNKWEVTNNSSVTSFKLQFNVVNDLLVEAKDILWRADFIY